MADSQGHGQGQGRNRDFFGREGRRRGTLITYPSISYARRPRSSGGESAGFLIPRSLVRVQPGSLPNPLWTRRFRRLSISGEARRKPDVGRFFDCSVTLSVQGAPPSAWVPLPRSVR